MIACKTDGKTLFYQSSRVAKTILLSFCAVFFVACGGQEVMKARTEEQAIRTVSILKQHGIEASIEPDKESNPPKFSVVVSNPLFTDENTFSAQSLITDYCLAQEDPAPIVETGMVQSQEMEAEKVKRQTRIMILEQLHRMPGVVCPEVGVSLPRGDSILNPVASSVNITASTVGESTITPDDLFNAAKGSVPSLKLENFSGRLHPKEIRPVKPASSRTATIAIISTALILILGSIAAVFFLQKRRSSKNAAVLPAEDEYGEDFLTEGDEDAQSEALALRENEN